jgi:hypothetical protein
VSPKDVFVGDELVARRRGERTGLWYRSVGDQVFVPSEHHPVDESANDLVAPVRRKRMPIVRGWFMRTKTSNNEARERPERHVIRMNPSQRGVKHRHHGTVDASGAASNEFAR